MTEKTSAISDAQASAQHQVQKLKQNAHYQQIQNELSQKKIEQQDQKVQETKGVDFQDKVEIKSLFNWKKGEDGEFEIQSENRIGIVTNAKDLKYSGDKVLRLLGYKINLTEKIDSLKESYRKLYIDSRSSNLLMAKFSQIKFGMINMLLSVLGISTIELQKLQKQALKESIDENIQLFEQNEYSDEMLKVFSSKSNRKDKQKFHMLNEVRKQLIEQMECLGETSYYTQDRINTIKKEQVNKILEDLSKEYENMQYMMEFQA